MSHKVGRVGWGGGRITLRGYEEPSRDLRGGDRCHEKLNLSLVGRRELWTANKDLVLKNKV